MHESLDFVYTIQKHHTGPYIGASEDWCGSVDTQNGWLRTKYNPHWLYMLI